MIKQNKKEYKIGFVATNYNNSEYTIDYIKSIKDMKFNDESIIVIVDNNSNKKNIDLLKNKINDFKDTKILFCNENLGYFNGLNKGIDYINELCIDIKYIVIGNNDLVFPNEFYEQILAKRDLFEKYAVISPNIVTLDGFHQNPHVIRKIGFVRELIYNMYYFNYFLARIIKFFSILTNRFTDRSDEKYHNVAQEIYQGHGSCYILGPLFFENFKQLNAPTFMMGEELFLSLQLKNKNLKLFYEPTITVFHHCHASIDKVPKYQIWKMARNAHREYRKHIRLLNFYKHSFLG